MTFNEYQTAAETTAVYPNQGKNYTYPTLGLCGETGEVAEKVKKLIRDKDGKVDGEFQLAIQKELGDVLWYVAMVASEFGLSLHTIAAGNIAKLMDRYNRGVVHGNGDER